MMPYAASYMPEAFSIHGTSMPTAPIRNWKFGLLRSPRRVDIALVPAEAGAAHQHPAVREPPGDAQIDALVDGVQLREIVPEQRRTCRGAPDPGYTRSPSDRCHDSVTSSRRVARRRNQRRSCLPMSRSFVAVVEPDRHDDVSRNLPLELHEVLHRVRTLQIVGSNGSSCRD